MPNEIEPIRLIVKDRREGKTTELIKWLLGGKQQAGYPGWSRVIVCTNASSMMNCHRMIRHYTQPDFKFACDRLLPHKPEDCADVHQRMLNDVRKAAWSLNDLQHNMRGATKRNFEYVVDDVDELIRRALGNIHFAPVGLTMTGVVVDNLRD
jgi:hypothetical protein